MGDAPDAPDMFALPLLGGRWALLPSLLDGRVLTHRVTDVEARHDLLLAGAVIAPYSFPQHDLPGVTSPAPLRTTLGRD